MTNQFEIILYVANQEKSKNFYAQLFHSPSLDVPGMTEFDLGANLKLGLMPEVGIAKILNDKTPNPSSGNGIPRCELYIKSDNAFNLFNIALKAGAVLVSDFSARDWGDTVGYVMDFDGHIIAFAE